MSFKFEDFLTNMNEQNNKLHSPEELLIVADTLLLSEKPELMRAVVLESITALEAYVHEVVFSNLEQKLPIDLVDLLKTKTQMDFDSRLSVLVPAATGREINKSDLLWQDYKKSKEIRNKVTHSGRMVTFSDAKFVLNTVYKWISYLGSTVEVELSLISLKRYIEENRALLFENKTIKERRLEEIVSNYFNIIKPSKLKLGSIVSKSKEIKRKSDIILEFGDHVVMIEVKIANNNFDEYLDGMIIRLKRMLDISGIDRGAIVIFSLTPYSKYYEEIRSIDNGRISIITIS